MLSMPFPGFPGPPAQQVQSRGCERPPPHPPDGPLPTEDARWDCPLSGPVLSPTPSLQ